MTNATARFLDEPVGSLFAFELFVSVMANSTTLTSNISTLVSTLSSTERDVTEFAEYTPSSSLASDNESFRDYTDNNCSNEYCLSDADYISLMEDHIFPTAYEWIMIALHAVVFVVGLVGNALVCVAVYRNHSMRTVTNYFIVNLAVADFMVIFFCLPPTVVWDVTETWFLGTALCKIVVYFQTVSVAISVLTLTFISVDRWYAICFPLKFKSTTGRAKTAIIVIWLLALAVDIPELMVLQTERRKDLPVDTHFFTQCGSSWSEHSELTFHVLKAVLLYTVPLIFMSVAYCQIVRVLWRSDNIPGHTETRNYYGITPCNNAVSANRRNTLNTNANVTIEGQLRSRRKAAKMLVAVVIMFAGCYFPVHMLSILRYTMGIPTSDVTVAIAQLAHWLCYFNSAVNPVIYNFMSGKFRREFKRTFLQCRCLYNITSSPSQTGHFGNHVSTASEFPMTSTFTPGSIRGGCYLPSSNTSSIRHQGRRHLSNGEKSSSSRLLVPSSGSSVDYGSKHGRSPRLTLSVDGVPAVRAFP